MQFLAVLLSSIISPLVVAIPLYVRWIRKKEKPDWKNFLIECGFSSAINFLFCLIVFLFGLAFFSHAKALDSLWYYLAISLVLSFINPGKLVWTCIRNKEKPTRKEATRVGVSAGLLTIFLLVDAMFYNGASLKKNANPISIDPSDTTHLTYSGFTKNEDGSLTANTNSPYIIVSHLEKDTAKYASFVFDKTNSQFELVVSYRSGLTWTRLMAYDVNASYESYCDINLIESYTEYRFTFNIETTRKDNVHEWTFRKVTINAPIAYKVSPLRYLFVFAICYFLAKTPSIAKKITEMPSKTGAAKITVLVGVGVSVIALLIIALVSPRGPGQLLLDYPVERDVLATSNVDLYVKLFDGLNKGHLYLDVDPDPKLVALGMDVYDPAARRAAGATYLWDHAFYNGHYYSYFGVAPVILVSFPVYWITRCAATGLYLQFFAFILTLGAFFYLSIVLVELFQFKPNPIGYALLVLCIASGSMIFNMVCFRVTDFKYRVAFDYGIMGICWFVPLVLEAYRKAHPRIMLGLAGFAFVIICGSRPTLAVWMLLLLPLLLKMLFFDKTESWKNRILKFVPMVCVLLVGGTLLAIYNVLRFEKVTEFGQTYNLTSFDMRTFHWRWDGMPGAIFHYVFQPPVSRNIFGYITSQYTTTSFDVHPHRASTIGLAFDPMFYFWGFLIAAFVFDKNVERRIMYVLAPIVAIMAITFTYTMGGVNWRYLLDLYPMAGVVALIAFARFASLPVDPQLKTAGLFVAVILGVGAFMYGVNTVSIPFDGMRGEDMGGWFYYALRDLLGAYNTLGIIS